MGQRLLGLYEHPEEKEHRLKHILESSRSISADLQEKFIFFVAVSLVVHLLIIGFLAIPTRARPGIPEQLVQSNEAALSLAIMNVEKETPIRMPSGQSASMKELESVSDSLDKLFSFDPKMTDKEKADVFEDLLQMSLQLDHTSNSKTPLDLPKIRHLIELLKQKKNLKLSSGNGFLIAEPGPEGKYEVYKANKASLDVLQKLKEEAGQGNSGVHFVDGMLRLRTAEWRVSIPEEYYFKKSPYQQILALGAHLFTVFRGFPDLTTKRNESAVEALSDIQSKTPERELHKSYFVYLATRRPAQIEKMKTMVLNLSDNERARILDQLMALKESDQLDIFKKRYLDVYDPDEEALAKLTKEFFFSNMNSVFIETGRFSSAFDFIEEIYYKRPFFDLFASYGSRFPRTKTGIEALFYLASAYEFEDRALENLFSAHGDIKGIMEGEQKPPGVYQPVMKAFVLSRMYPEIYRFAGEMGLPLEGLLDEYIHQQETIYGFLADLGGEVKNRALYAWGRLYWEHGEYERAMEKWKQIDPNYPISSPVYWDNMREVERYGLEESIKSVDENLLREAFKDQYQLLQRRLKFHAWEKRVE
jgi:hypothetical protein